MARYFNTEGLCDPDIHYMVYLDERLSRIKRIFVDRGKYFVINRGRQYGKTTTLRALAQYLKEEYLVVSMDFQLLSPSSFENEQQFVTAFAGYFVNRIKGGKDGADILASEINSLEELAGQEKDKRYDMAELFMRFSSFCRMSSKPVVLMIDEVDSASNNQVFLDFLAMLRGYYLERKDRPAFHSVILAGVYDIKNLKLKIRTEEEHKYNSPWNTHEGNEPRESLLSFGDCPWDQTVHFPFDIAAKFSVDMSFSAQEIGSMLREYEADNHIGMDVDGISECIYEYTSGYPFLVSYICKCLDEELPGPGVWTREGVLEAVKILLKENTPLFDSMIKQLDIYKDLRKMTEEILYQGKRVPFSPHVESVNLGMMFGYLGEENGQVKIANRIFEMGLLNMFIAQESVGSRAYECGERNRNQFIRDSRLDMERE